MAYVVGREGTGTLTLADGGTLVTGTSAQPLKIAELAGSVGELDPGSGGLPGVLNASAVSTAPDGND